MNLLHYKWPALAVACLHGSLFLLPKAPITPQYQEIDISPPLPALPPDEPIKIYEEPIDDPSPFTHPGGPAVSTLPDIPAPITDTTRLAIPVDNSPPVIGLIATTLVNYTGYVGPDTKGPVGRPFEITTLDKTPRATVQNSPKYPENLRKEGIAGSVTVQFEVDSTGRVYHAEALHATNSGFVDPAVRAVLQWRFEPGKHNGRAVPFRMAVPVEFSLGTS